VLLELRLRSGLPLDLLTPRGLQEAERYVAAGLLSRHADRVALTTPGRLLADAVVRDLVD
jgi:oxygen-independent coproporphyrinogen-3 oxidase